MKKPKLIVDSSCWAKWALLCRTNGLLKSHIGINIFVRKTGSKIQGTYFSPSKLILQGKANRNTNLMITLSVDIKSYLAFKLSYFFTFKSAIVLIFYVHFPSFGVSANTSNSLHQKSFMPPLNISIIFSKFFMKKRIFGKIPKSTSTANQTVPLITWNGFRIQNNFSYEILILRKRNQTAGKKLWEK